VIPALESFRQACATVLRDTSVPAGIVRRIAPDMRALAIAAPAFLEASHRRADPEHYARNLIFSDDDTLSLFALVWTPGQWTPIHDHGTWGVVGIVEGVLEEQAYMRTDADPCADRDAGIALAPGDLVLLPPGSVSTFVPNPDHIHVTGVPLDRPLTLSLHLYGRMLNNFHVYDRPAGTRRLIEAEHTDT
jgi:predicted metal-dependent enzyme (double-stranded beta helix superfamily)